MAGRKAEPPEKRAPARRRPPEPPRKAEKLPTARWRIAEAGAAVAAFILSLGVFLLGGLQALKGPEIVILPPDHILLYRDAPTADNDALMLVAEVGMINTARSDFGDVAVQVHVELPAGPAEGTRFPYDAMAEPVFTIGDGQRDTDCPVDARCVVPSGLDESIRPRATGLRVIERRRTMLSVPGGSSRSEWLNFSFSGCDGPEPACARFYGFEEAVAALRQVEQLSFRITMDFHTDGIKTAECIVESESVEDRHQLLDYLERFGWATLRCRQEQ